MKPVRKTIKEMKAWDLMHHDISDSIYLGFYKVRVKGGFRLYTDIDLTNEENVRIMYVDNDLSVKRQILKPEDLVELVPVARVMWANIRFLPGSKNRHEADLRGDNGIYDVQNVLTEDEAQGLKRKKAGDKIDCFFSYEDAAKACVERFTEMCPVGTLVSGQIDSPSRALFSPHMDDLNSLWLNYESLFEGGVSMPEDNRKEAFGIVAEWKETIEKAKAYVPRV